MTTPHDMTDNVEEIAVEASEVAEPTEGGHEEAPPVDEVGDGEEAAVDTGVTGPRLIVKRQGAETEEVFAFVAPATIGRFDPTVGPIDIDLGGIEEGGYVSRKHAKITEEDGVFSIHDLGSSNGVYLLTDEEFQKVSEGEITDGTEIALGNARFVFRIS